jgi:hypothetical protein
MDARSLLSVVVEKTIAMAYLPLVHCASREIAASQPRSSEATLKIQQNCSKKVWNSLEPIRNIRGGI